MNIFAVHNDPIVSACTLCDKHILKMIVETAQLLSTAKRLLDGTLVIGKSATGRNVKRWKLADVDLEAVIYQAGYVDHPSAIWCRSTDSNYWWLQAHGWAMCQEYTRRYGKTHKTQAVMEVLSRKPDNIRIGTLESFALAMPDEFKLPDSVDAYRNYYIKAKSRFAYWKDQYTVPYWFWEGCKKEGVVFKNDSPDLDYLMSIVRNGQNEQTTTQNHNHYLSRLKILINT